MRQLTLIFIASLFLFSCDPPPAGIGQGYMDTYVPIYGTLSEIEQISLEPKQPTVNPGKIYAFGNFIFQNERDSGIHIIDNTHHDNPQKVAFLKLPLNTDISIRGNYLYANNYVDMVVFDISDPAHIHLVKRVANVFAPVDQDFPPFRNVYFQCPDKSKGIVVRWEKQNIPTPKCRR